MNKKIHQTSEQTYDAFSSYYRHYSEKKSSYLAAVDKLILQNLPSETKRIFDAGCGDGVRGQKLFSQTQASELWMIDSSQEMCKLAERFAASNIKILPIDIAKENLASLPVEYFDCAWCLWNVLGHIIPYTKRVQALSNIKRLLKLRGRLLINVSNHYNIAAYGPKIILNNIWNNIVSPSPDNVTIDEKIKIDGKEINYYCHFFNPRELPALCRELNLKILRTIYVNYSTGEITGRWRGHIYYVIEKVK